MPKAIGCVSPAQSGRLVFADTESLGFLNLASGEIQRVRGSGRDCPGVRFNDGKVDRAGRFWVGTMDEKESLPIGGLFRLDPDLSFRRMADGFVCANGLGWSPDNRIMYFTDSLVRTIWSYEFDFGTGELGVRRPFAKFAEHDGMPDGLTVDRQGFIWTAIWDGWRVIRFAPDGTIDREIPVPVQRPTSCTFGGTDLNTLYITSACTDLNWRSLRNGPLAGALFAAHPGVDGLAETPFRG
jgi:L-arabinonolactonase